MDIEAAFVTSAAAAAGLPRDGTPEVALIGRSNVGKSSLINALVRQRLARTSAAPGKTRLANIYRVARGSGSPLYLVDLPGYGYARGACGTPAGIRGAARRSGAAAVEAAAGTFEALTRDYFSGVRLEADTMETRRIRPHPGLRIAAILLVDARHPGLDSDRAAWQWIRTVVADAAIVATKIDKLARGQRIRATRKLESVFDEPVLPVSAVTGEGLDELWKLIDRLTNSHNPRRRNPAAPTPPPPKR